jgi:hypothetical protein
MLYYVISFLTSSSQEGGTIMDSVITARGFMSAGANRKNTFAPIFAVHLITN